MRDVGLLAKQPLATVQLAVNGGCPCNAQLLSEVGVINILLGETVVAWQRKLNEPKIRNILQKTDPLKSELSEDGD